MPMNDTPARSAREWSGVGIGLRAPHYREFLTASPAVDWVEVHSENFLGDGGFDLHVLEDVRARYPVALHGVGLSLAAGPGLDDQGRFEHHLSRIAALARRIEPALVSEHLSFGALDARHFNDLLPIPYTREALGHVVSRVARAQEALGRPLVVENVSSYLAFRASEMSELEFLAALAATTGCGVLLDVNNLYVNAFNHGFDAKSELERFPHLPVREIHLAGHAAADDTLIDDHGARVAQDVWSLYEDALRLHGPVPTLVEWDTNIPALDVLVGEADGARCRMHARG